jgi:hypothetical protein
VLDLPSLEFLLVDYFAKFGDKLVCSTDLGIILPSICPSLLLSFFDSLQSAYDNFDKVGIDLRGRQAGSTLILCLS